MRQMLPGLNDGLSQKADTTTSVSSCFGGSFKSWLVSAKNIASKWVVSEIGYHANLRSLYFRFDSWTTRQTTRKVCGMMVTQREPQYVGKMNCNICPLPWDSFSIGLFWAVSEIGYHAGLLSQNRGFESLAARQVSCSYSNECCSACVQGCNWSSALCGWYSWDFADDP